MTSMTSPYPNQEREIPSSNRLRSNYETVAKKVGETASYPGNWLYESWSESGKLPATIFECIPDVP